MTQLNKIFATLILIFITLTSSAQISDNDKSELRQESFLTFDLFSSLNTFNPRWKIGYIKGINEKWKVGLNVGYGNKNISYTYFADKFEENFTLWELRPELYKIVRQNEKTTKYLSLELFYINHKDIFHNNYYYPESGGEISYDQADYQRHKYGFNVNIGEFIKIGKGFGINIYTGLGLRIRDVSFSNIVNPRPSDTFIDMIDFNIYRKDEGIDFGLNYSIGLKLLFR